MLIIFHPVVMTTKNTIRKYLYPILVVLLIFIGVLFRLRLFIINRSLWFDEALLALNIVGRSLRELALPLDYHQGAPLGFLFLEKGMISIFGSSDLVLRIVPFIAGIISIFLFYRLSTYLFSEFGVLLSLALFIFADKLIYYASEVKQYSSDVVIVLLLYVFSIPLFNGEKISTRQYITWGLICGLSLWFSHPSIFVVAAIGAGLAFKLFQKRAWEKMKWLVIGIAIIMINFILLYLISLRYLAQNNVLIDFWGEYFLPFPPWENPAWFKFASCNMLIVPVGFSSCQLGLLLLGVGAISCLIVNLSWGLIIVLPFLNTIIASAFHLYPFGNRLMLFVVPLIFIGITQGVEQIRRTTAKYPLISLSVWSLLAFFLIISPVKKAYQMMIAPDLVEDIKPVLAYVQEEKDPGDLICGDIDAMPAYEYYSKSYGLPETSCVTNMISVQDPGEYAKQLAAGSSTGRIWFLFAHKTFREGVDNESVFMESVGQMGQKIDEIHASGASAYLISVVDP